MTTTAMHPDAPKALALLAVGHTVQTVADHVSWPVSAVRGLVGGQRGWLINADGCVYDPGKKDSKPQVPDAVDEADLVWARRLLSRTAPAPARPAAAKPKPPAAATPSQLPTSPTAGSSPAKPAAAVRGTAAIDGPITTELPLAWIHANTSNIRADVGDVTELAASIRAHGLLQPLTVRPHPTLSDQYQLLAGHRRHTAALEAGLTHAPAVIRYDVTDNIAIEVMLVENVQRRDLNPMEKAEAIGKLRAKGYSGALISSRTGIPEGTISALLALLELDDASKQRVRDGELTATDAIAAVRRLRKKAREGKAAGSAVKPWSWEPDHLAASHPLARKAARYCEAREHNTRRRVGQVACGQCWETAIRKDEQVVIAAEQQGGDA